MQIAFVTSFTVLMSLPGNRGIPEHPSRHVLLTPGAPRSSDQPSPQARMCFLRSPGEDPEPVEREQRSEDEGQSVQSSPVEQLQQHFSMRSPADCGNPFENDRSVTV